MDLVPSPLQALPCRRFQLGSRGMTSIRRDLSLLIHDQYLKYYVYSLSKVDFAEIPSQCLTLFRLCSCPSESRSRRQGFWVYTRLTFQELLDRLISYQ